MPNIVDIQPAGTHLMEDFYYAGGLPAVLKIIRDSLQQRCDHRQRQNDLGERAERRGAATRR